MPFDATPPVDHLDLRPLLRKPAVVANPTAVSLIDILLGFFGPNGEHWCSGYEVKYSGERCLWGAITMLPQWEQAQLLPYLIRAMPEGYKPHGPVENPVRHMIIRYNDCMADYWHVKNLLLNARQIALANWWQPEIVPG